MGVSIAGLFAAGILPGLLICIVCMALIAIFGKRWNLPKGDTRPSLMGIIAAFRMSIPRFDTSSVYSSGQYSVALVTPTEAASVALAYSLFIAVVVYRSITWSDLFHMMVRTARITGVIFLIIASASILGWWDDV